MVIFLPESEGNLVCCKAIGKLTDEDLHNLVVRIERILEIHGSFLLYVNLEFFKVWEWQAAWGKKFMERNAGIKSKKFHLSVTKGGKK